MTFSLYSLFESLTKPVFELFLGPFWLSERAPKKRRCLSPSIKEPIQSRKKQRRSKKRNLEREEKHREKIGNEAQIDRVPKVRPRRNSRENERVPKYKESRDYKQRKERALAKIETTKLPEDIIFEILSWLPAKSICRFKSCSKSIYEFTKDTNFAPKQSQNLMLNDDLCFFIQGRIFQWNNCKTEIYALPGEKASSGVPTNFLNFLNENSARIVASSNGLLLCQIIRKNSTPTVQLFICNPTTQSCSSISTPYSLLKNPFASVIFVFECNHNRGVDYEESELFLFENNLNQQPDSFGCKIYMPKEDVWKERERSFFVGDRSMRFDLPVFHKGAIHIVSSWSPHIGRSSPYIASYTLKSGISRMFKLPKEAIETAQQHQCYEYEMRIFKWGKVGSSNESICLVRLVKRFVFTIWVLTDYKSSSWSQFLTISLKQMGLRKKNSIVVGFTVMNGDSLVFGTRSTVYRYDLIGKRKRRLEEICEHGFDWDLRFVPYSNTLRSFGTGAATFRSLRGE